MSAGDVFRPGLAEVMGKGEAMDMEAVQLAGGASNRTYHRVRADGRSWVVMVLADEPLRSEEASEGPAPTELPFLQVQRFLHTRGVSVPAIHHVDRVRGHLWLDDLGDIVLGERLGAASGDARVDAYRAAIDLLHDFQRATAGSHASPICYARRFTPSLLRWELDHYREWRVEAQLERTLTAATSAALGEAFDALVARLVSMPQILCHRDFQSTNLMDTAGGLVLLDFQDALMGPYPYDLVALIRDSYIPLAMTQVDRLVDYYLAGRPDLDPTAFREAFLLQTVQRKLKDAGRFVYIERVKNNPHYLPFIEPSLGYVRDALDRLPALAPLRGLLADLDPEAFA